MLSPRHLPPVGLWIQSPGTAPSLLTLGAFSKRVWRATAVVSLRLTADVHALFRNTRGENNRRGNSDVVGIVDGVLAVPRGSQSLPRPRLVAGLAGSFVALKWLSIASSLVTHLRPRASNAPALAVDQG